MALTGVITYDVLACYNPPPPPCEACEDRTESGGCVDRDCGSHSSCCHETDSCLTTCPDECFKIEDDECTRKFDSSEEFACRFGDCDSQCQRCRNVCECCTSTGCQTAQVTEIYGPKCLDYPIAFYSATTSPCLRYVNWSIDGEPVELYNGLYLQFETCGPHTVTATIGNSAKTIECSASKSIPVNVCCDGSACCAGDCYNTAVYQCCDDTEDEYICDIDETCDDNFLGEVEPPSGMLGVCQQSVCYVGCSQMANAYYNAVSDWGPAAYEAAQECSCN